MLFALKRNIKEISLAEAYLKPNAVANSSIWSLFLIDANNNLS